MRDIFEWFAEHPNIRLEVFHSPYTPDSTLFEMKLTCTSIHCVLTIRGWDYDHLSSADIISYLDAMYAEVMRVLDEEE